MFHMRCRCLIFADDYDAFFFHACLRADLLRRRRRRCFIFAMRCCFHFAAATPSLTCFRHFFACCQRHADELPDAAAADALLPTRDDAAELMPCRYDGDAAA